MIPYPINVTAAQVLTSALFAQYGGDTGTYSSAMLDAALAVAEQFAAEELQTFLEPTTVTGQFHPYAYGQPFNLPTVRVSALNAVVLVCENNRKTCATTDLSTCGHLLRPEFGIVRVNLPTNYCSPNQCQGCGGPVFWRIVWTAGLSTGVSATTPAILLSLTVAAKEVLNQIGNPSASPGGPGAPGIIKWGTFSYREERSSSSVRQTAFGNSATATYAANLLKPWKVKRALKLGY